MILGFKKRFVAPILAGTKIHTFRLDEHHRWKAGNSIQFAIGVRTKDYETFREDGECMSTQHCVISINPKLRVLVGTRLLNDQEIEELAMKDGFTTAKEMGEFFWQEHKVTCLTGKIIHWTDYKY